MAREKTINNNTNILNAVNKVVDSFSFSVWLCVCVWVFRYFESRIC